MSIHSPVPFGSAESNGTAHTLRYELPLPHPVDKVWGAVATPDGLAGWLAAADPFEPGPGGEVTLRWQNTDTEGNATVAPGRITAWRRGSVVEYTVDVHGSVRFDLEPGPRDENTVLHFTNDFTGPESLCLDCLAGWHNHFEYLLEALDGHPKDWSTWTLERWRELREAYEGA
ncbi:SRPBCC domain-containing protein [Streptomyces sp. ODS28]|uniref:SRPBCC domain-containing protein n=1 Tax=Streptomyces sp. ODS28 TaxID=3136688 RepID=UPI0031E6CAC1